VSLQLTSDDRAKLDGSRGPGTRMAMAILVRMAEAAEAPGLIDIVGAHIDSAIYLGEATLAFAERLASLGARVCVPTSLNVSGVDEMGWREWAVPPEWAGQAARQMAAYRQMGCTPTWTCAPYQTALRPRFGDQIAWGESNAIAFANTAIGARTERYPDLLDICAAITGRVPAIGLHLTEPRAGQLLVRLGDDLPASVQAEDTFYPLLGHLIGRIAGERIPVVTGLQVRPSEDQLKALCAAAASSGAVALLHLVGVTPEAPTIDAAFQGRPLDDIETHDIGLPALRAAWRDLTTAAGSALDLVVLGSPHFSLAELAQLSPLLAGRRRHPDVRLLVTTSRIMRDLAESAGHLARLRDFGGQVTVDTCILATPMLQPGIRTLMTNSAKYAYYAPGLLGTRVVFGRLADCVASAEAGHVVRTPSIWDDPAS
jgi:cis-L-3-hydroxyproline dehydratase